MRSTDAARPSSDAKRQDLTALYGVGKKRAALLRWLGIRRYEDLLYCDLQEIGWELSHYDSHVKMAMLEGLRFHAQSYLDDRPLLFGELPEVGDSYLVVDLEYDAFELIWLTGVLLVEGERMHHGYRWAEDAAAERRNLESLAKILRAWSPRPVVTWAGMSADLPQLRHAVRRHGLASSFKETFTGHVDLFAHCEGGLRLPLPGLGLKAVSTFFGFKGTSPIPNGLEALRLHATYQESQDSRAKARLRSELVAYNCDDLRAVVATEKALRALRQSVVTVDEGRRTA